MRLIHLPALALSLLFACSSPDKNMSDITPPIAKRIDTTLSMHGDNRVDPYFWLNQRENQEVIAYLEAENAYTDTMLAHTKNFQEKLFQEIKGKIKETDMSVPYFENGYWYYTRFETGADYPIYCRKKGNLDTAEEILFNVNEFAKGHEFFSLSGINISPDNSKAIFYTDNVGRRQYTLQVKDLTTGEILPISIKNTNGGSAWANDNLTIFYGTTDDQTLRSDKVWKVKINEHGSNSKLVFHETDETFATYIYKGKSDKYLYIYSGSTLTSEQRFLDANTPDAAFKIIQTRTRGLEYSAEDYAQDFYITTNLDAQNFRLVKTPIKKATKENWVNVIEHRSDVLLEGAEFFENYLVLSERKAGLTQIRVKSWDGKQDYYLPFEDPAYAAYVSINPEYKTNKLRYNYTSMTTPGSVIDFDMSNKTSELKKQQEVVGGHDPKNYISERLFAKAQDGTEVPISLVYKKGTKLDGSSPLLLYAYGSYGASMDASFSISRLSLLDRGFVYAIAHIRGGQEMGRQWYEDGKLLKKKNTFTDFIDCADYLAAKKYAAADKIFALGGSAGGLLMGAVVNMRPDRFRGVVAAVPFVDVVTTMLDESIPLTTGEFDEWGNPNDKTYYDYMKSYSPYDNVSAQAYPAMLVTTGLHDSQVQYWEPAKWVAKLRATKTDQNMLLLKTDMSAGHGGKSGRFNAIYDTALEYAFLFNLIGIQK